MAHSHGDAAPEGSYLLDQVCTVAASFALGLAAFWMYQNDVLGIILIKEFWKPVAAGGIVVVLLSLVRTIALVRLTTLARTAAAKEAAAVHVHDENCGHDLGHDHAHAHSHAEPEAAHDHAGEEHDHGWAPWRYIVLALPVVLVLLRIPNDGFSADHWNKELAGSVSVQRISTKTLAAVAGTPWVLTKKSNPKDVMFNELTNISASAHSRDAYTGTFVRLRGQFFPYDDRNFTLYRLKISCCASDAIPLKVRIACDFVVSGVNKGDWVEVVGEVRFVKVPDKENEWLPVMVIPELKDIKPIEKPVELYESV